MGRAEFERALIRERTRAGLETARAQGRKGGRKPVLNAEQKADIADNVLSGRTKPVKRKYWDIKFVRVQRQAVYRTTDKKDYILYTNNRVNSPRYTADYYFNI